MLEFIRSHQRLMQFVLLLLILPSFTIWGVGSYLRDRNNVEGVATVDGQPITEADFQTAQQRELQRLQQRYGDAINPKLLDTPQARARTLQSLVDERVLAEEINRSHLAVSQQQVVEEIMAIPEIRRLYGPDGVRDDAAYHTLLASSGLTEAELFQEARHSMLMREVQGTIPSTSLVSQVVATRLNLALRQMREVQPMTLKPQDFVGQVKLADADVAAYYDAHKAEFVTPAKVDVQYVVLDRAAVAAQTQVSDEELRAAYAANQAKYGVPEERRASHILIAVKQGATPAERDAAKAKAQGILAQVRAHPEDFAKLAKQYSMDPGSAERGGDLDWAPASSYVAPFSKALFALKQNEISDLVETEFGYHIIEETGIRPSSVRPLEQVRADLEAELKKRKTASAFPDMAREFTDLVFNQFDTLDKAAQKFNLKVQTAQGVTRDITPPADPKNPLNNEKIRAELFSDDALKSRHNTEAVETQPGVLVAARVTAYAAPVQRTLAEESDRIRSKLTDEHARALTLKAGEERVAALQKSPSDVGFGPNLSVSRSNSAGVPPAGVKAIFAADVSTVPAFTGAQLDDGTYVLYRINKVIPAGPAVAAQEKQLVDALARGAGQLEYAGYMEGLQKKFKVHIVDEKGTSPPAS